MAGRIKGITVEIEGNTSKLTNALKGVDSSLSKTQSALNDVNKLLKFDGDNSELLRQKQQYLSQAIEQTEERLKTLRTASEQAAESAGNYDAYIEKLQPIQQEIDTTKDRLKELQQSAREAEEQLAAGEISQEQYDAIQQEIQETRSHLRELQTAARECAEEFGNPVSPEEFNSLQREIAATEGKLQSYQGQLDSMNTDQLTEEMQEAGNATSVFGDMLKANLTGDAIVSGAKKLAQALQDLLKDTVAYGDSVDKMSQKMGMSAESYQEWDSVMRHCGASMETLKASMKTLATQAETNQAAFEELGISQEQIASMSQEELFAATIAGLQNVEDSTRRTYLAGKTLGRGATELGALLNMSAEEVEAMKDKLHEMGAVMSDEAIANSVALKDATQDLDDAWNALKMGSMADVIPMLTELADALTVVVSKANELGIGLDDVSAFLTGSTFPAVSGTMDAIAESVREYGAAVQEGLGSGAAATEKFIEAQERMAPAAESARAAQEAMLSLAESASEALTSGGDLRAAYEQLSAQMADMRGPTDAETTALAEQALAVLNLAATNQELAGKYPALVSAANNAGVSLTQLSAYLIENGLTAEEWAGRVDSATDGVINSFQAVDTSLDMSLEDMAAALEANIAAYSDWNSNIATLMAAAQESGNASAVAFVQYMQELGVGAAEQVAAMVQDVDGTLATFAPLFEQAADQGMLEVLNGIEGGKPEATGAAEGVMDEAKAAMEGVDFSDAGQKKSQEVASGIQNGAGQISDAATQAIQQAISAASGIDASPVGYQFSMGVASGISAGSSAAISAAIQMARSALSAAKAELDIHSPSRRARDEIGRMYGQGAAEGIEDATPLVEAASADMAKAAAEELEAHGGELSRRVAELMDLEEQAKAEKEYEDHVRRIAELNEKLNDEELQDREAVLRQLQEEEDAWNEKQLQKQRTALQSRLSDLENYAKESRKLWEQSMSDTIRNGEYSAFLIEKNGGSRADQIAVYKNLQKELHRQAEEARAMGLDENDEYIQSLSRKWWAYEDTIRKLEDETVQEAQDKWNAYAKSLQEAMDAVTAKQEAMRDKLSGYGDLFKAYHGQYTGNTYINLTDLDKQTKAIETYGETLERLKARGISGDMMQEILGLSMDEASAYGQKLLSMSDSDWDKYMESYEKKQQAAASVAEKFYASEFDALEQDFAGKLPDALEELTEHTDPIGTRIADGIIESFLAKSEELRQTFVDVLTGASSDAWSLIASPTLGAETVSAPAAAPAASGSGSADEATALLRSIAASLGQDTVLPINLDGVKIAEVELDPLVRVAASRGTPIVSIS